MLPKLSIIIPCYNCAETLTQAVESCFAQGLTIEEFEIVMVDDGSQDQTRLVMESLAAAHPNISLVFHTENKGGGAARNTGIQNSTGAFLYCLDSDNVFAQNSLPRIIAHLRDTSVDGAAFYERRFFPGNNLASYTTHHNTIVDRTITLEDLFTNDILLDNFFFTREAYLRTTGYPEHHGFDTQCFEVRFLSAGNAVTIVPDSVFYHRHAGSEPSYFERVHNAGLFSVNMMLIFEEIFHLLTPTAQRTLIEFPIFTNTHSNSTSVLQTIRHLALSKDLFTSDAAQQQTPTGRTLWLTHSNNKHKELVACFESMTQSDYLAALEHFTIWQNANHIDTPYIHFLYLRLGTLLSGCPKSKHITKTLSVAKSITVIPINPRGGRLWRMLRHHTLVQWLVRIVKKTRYEHQKN